VSEWNVPDWRDPAQYPHPRDCSLRQWAWEFLRRNPEYRSLWREHIEPFYDPAFRYQDQDVGPVGPAHDVPADRQAGLVHRFGLDSFPPSPDDHRPPLFIRAGLRYIGEREARLLLYEGQIAVIFDLTRPIGRQMAAAKKLLTEEKKRSGHREHRNRIEHFVPYLCTLDAVYAGATHTEIGARLFEDQSAETRLFTVRDYWDAATRLRDRDFLFIAAGGEKADTRLG
jgi:Family of unknown function (DUF6499)